MVKAYAELFEKYADTFEQLGVNPNNGFGDVEPKSLRCTRPTRRDQSRHRGDLRKPATGHGQL